MKNKMPLSLKNIANDIYSILDLKTPKIYLCKKENERKTLLKLGLKKSSKPAGYFLPLNNEIHMEKTHIYDTFVIFVTSNIDKNMDKATNDAKNLGIDCLNVLKLLYDNPSIEFTYSKNKPSCFSMAGKFREKGCKLIVNIGEDSDCKITALLHEIGHAMDYMRMGPKFYDMPKNAKEKSAWRNAIHLSKQYNIPLCPIAANYALATYGITYRPLMNLMSKNQQEVVDDYVTKNNKYFCQNVIDKCSALR